MKRFYKLVSTSKDGVGWAVLLDGKSVNTPSRNKLVALNENLANAVVQEWSSQGENIAPETMPLTQILSTRIDRVAAERKTMSDTILNYLDTDLICYRTEMPSDLKERQEQTWDKWIDWFAGRFGTSLKTTTSLAALRHDEGAHEAVKAHVEALDDDVFTVLQLVVSASGSLVLGLAFAEGEISPEDVFAAARVEESYKAEVYDEEKYGPDPAQDEKDKAVKSDLKSASLYLNLLKE